MPRGSRPGEHRGGRKKGTPNRTTAEIRELAQQHGPLVLKTLAALVKKADCDAVRVSAGKELLERGYGKSNIPVQQVSVRGTIGRYDVSKLADLSDEELADFAATLARIDSGLAGSPAAGDDPDGDSEA